MRTPAVLVLERLWEEELVAKEVLVREVEEEAEVSYCMLDNRDVT